MTRALPDHILRYRELLPREEHAAFVAWLSRPLPQTVAVNPTRLTARGLADTCADHLSLTPIPWFPGAFRLHPEDRPGRHWSYTAGLYSVQEEASLVPVRMLDVRPGQRVLDLCAAPGNKTAQLALALGNRGTLVANDLKVGRLTALHDIARRLGLVNISTTGHDGCVYPVSPGQFDRILVDAPCTGEGKARRGHVRPSSGTFRSFVAGQQRTLLRRAIALCRPGGRIVYSTCTFAPEENEAVISDVLTACGDQVRALAPEFEVPGARPGLGAHGDRAFHPDVRHARRLWPHLTDTGGFFAVALERTGRHEDTDPGPALFAPLPPTPAHDRLAPVLDRFGIPAAALTGLHRFEDHRHVRLVAADHAPPAGVELENLGLDVLRRRSAHPKLSTAAALLLGSTATRNRIDLDASELARWRAREDVDLEARLPDGCAPGYQVVHHRGLPVGMGLLRYREGGPILESLFPKAWSRPLVDPR